MGLWALLARGTLGRSSLADMSKCCLCRLSVLSGCLPGLLGHTVAGMTGLSRTYDLMGPDKMGTGQDPLPSVAGLINKS